MRGFIEWLEKLNKNDNRIRAVLKRSLAFEMGCYASAYPFVEPFISESCSGWQRRAYYLTAATWASHWRDGRVGPAMSIGKASATQQEDKGSRSTERRFINLLDADTDQLPYRLRQMIGLLNEYNIDYDNLLTGLTFWNVEHAPTQNAWARDFYRNLKQYSGETNSNDKENAE
ncbi:MAG: type I-E CRISPR-associated protein Cse2/CasB [Syntrophales bacterium]